MAKLPLGNSVLRFCLAAVTIVLTSTSSSEAFSQTARPTRCSSTSLFSESSNSGGYVEEYDDFANFSSTQLTSSSPTTSPRHQTRCALYPLPPHSLHAHPVMYALMPNHWSHSLDSGSFTWIRNFCSPENSSDIRQYY